MNSTKKKIISAAVVIALLAVALIGGTLAYFSDTKTEKNTFTVGDVKILLDEEKIDTKIASSSVTYEDMGYRTQLGNEYKLIYPGATLPKDPTVHNTGKNPAYIRAKITVSDKNAMDEFFGKIVGPNPPKYPTAQDAYNAFFTIDSEWELKKEEIVGNTRVYTFNYKDILAAGAATTPVFNGITIPKWLNNAELESLQKTGFSLTVTAEAIQADGFADADAAWTAFEAQ